MKPVLIKFQNSWHVYSFLTHLELKENDLVVCKSSCGYDIGRVFKVNNLTPKETKNAKAFIVQKIDTETYKKVAEEYKVENALTLVKQIKKLLEDYDG